MKDLRISISKAQLTGFSVELKQGKPEVTATIALLTDSGKSITSYTIATDDWRSESKFKLPVEIMPLIGDVARVLEGVAVRHCQQGQLALPAPKASKAKRAKPVVNDDLDLSAIDDDEPINLDDIDF